MANAPFTFERFLLIGQATKEPRVGVRKLYVKVLEQTPWYFGFYQTTFARRLEGPLEFDRFNANSWSVLAIQ